jgi:hypothetical protein
MNLLIGVSFIIALVGIFFYTHILALRSGIERPVHFSCESCNCRSGCATDHSPHLSTITPELLKDNPKVGALPSK